MVGFLNGTPLTGAPGAWPLNKACRGATLATGLHGWVGFLVCNRLVSLMLQARLKGNDAPGAARNSKMCH